MSATRWIASVVGLVLVQSVVATNVAGQATPPPQFNYNSYTQIGAGGSDCGAMTKNLQTEREKWLVPYLYWEQGFLTGVNFTAFRNKQGDPHVGQGASKEPLFAAVEHYCEQHPERTIGDAVSVVYYQLGAPL